MMKWDTDFKKWWSVKVFSQYFYGQTEKKNEYVIQCSQSPDRIWTVCYNFQMYRVATVQSMVF